MQYPRRGQKEYSVLGILDVRVRFTNGMELSQSEGDLNELFGIIRKMLG